MIVKLLTEHYLEFLSLKGGCIGTPESTHVTMPHCWISHVPAHICIETTYWWPYIFTDQNTLNNKQRVICMRWFLASADLIHVHWVPTSNVLPCLLLSIT